MSDFTNVPLNESTITGTQLGAEMMYKKRVGYAIAGIVVVTVLFIAAIILLVIYVPQTVSPRTSLEPFRTVPQNIAQEVQKVVDPNNNNVLGDNNVLNENYPDPFTLAEHASSHKASSHKSSYSASSYKVQDSIRNYNDKIKLRQMERSGKMNPTDYTLQKGIKPYPNETATFVKVK